MQPVFFLFFYYFYNNSRGGIQKQEISQFSHTKIIFAVEQVRDAVVVVTLLSQLNSEGLV